METGNYTKECLHRFCKKCGAELVEGALCCHKCATEVKKEYQAEISPEINENKVGKKKTKSNVIIVVITILVLVAITVCLYFFLKPEENSGSNIEGTPSSQGSVSQVSENAENEEKKDLLIKETYYDVNGEVTGWFNFEYDENGNETLTRRCGSDGSIEVEYESVYDNEGKLVKYITRHWYNYNYSGVEESWDEYEYDENGNKKKIIEYGSDGTVYSWYEFRYDDNGKMTKQTRYDSDGTIESAAENEYDSNGNCVRSTDYNSGGTVSQWTEYEYDDNGNLTKQARYSFDGTLSYGVENKYNEKGDLIETKELTGGATSVTSFTYDEEGKVIKATNLWDGSYTEVEYNENGGILKVTDVSPEGAVSQKVEYNERGNEIKYTIYDANGEAVEWVEFEYKVQ